MRRRRADYRAAGAPLAASSACTTACRQRLRRRESWRCWAAAQRGWCALCLASLACCPVQHCVLPYGSAPNARSAACAACRTAQLQRLAAPGQLLLRLPLPQGLRDSPGKSAGAAVRTWWALLPPRLGQHQKQRCTLSCRPCRPAGCRHDCLAAAVPAVLRLVRVAFPVLSSLGCWPRCCLQRAQQGLACQATGCACVERTSQRLDAASSLCPQGMSRKAHTPAPRQGRVQP